MSVKSLQLSPGDLVESTLIPGVRAYLVEPGSIPFGKKRITGWRVYMLHNGMYDFMDDESIKLVMTGREIVQKMLNEVKKWVLLS